MSCLAPPRTDSRPAGRKVIFIGDCADWEGELQGQLVQIRSVYEDGRKRDPTRRATTTCSPKWQRVSMKMLWNEGTSHIRLRGCPVSVCEQVLAVVALSDVNNPYLDMEHAVPFQKKTTWRGEPAKRCSDCAGFRIKTRCLLARTSGA